MPRIEQEPWRALMELPGVGESISRDLWDIGICSPSDLREGDPQQLYERLCARQGAALDRCVLYVMRCAVYYASNTEHQPELLKWWAWKDSAK